MNRLLTLLLAIVIALCPQVALAAGTEVGSLNTASTPRVAGLGIGVGSGSSGLIVNGGVAAIGTNTVTFNNPELNVDQTWNNAGVSNFNVIDANVTATAGSGNLLSLRSGGTQFLKISNFNALTTGYVMTTDTAPPVSTLAASSAYAQASSNKSGANLVVAGGIGSEFFTIVTASSLSGKTFTVAVNGTSTTKTDGADFTHSGTNSVEATNLAGALTTISGVSATAVGAVVYVTPLLGTYALTLSTNAGAPATATNSTIGQIVHAGIASWSAGSVYSVSSPEILLPSDQDGFITIPASTNGAGHILQLTSGNGQGSGNPGGGIIINTGTTGGGTGSGGAFTVNIGACTGSNQNGPVLTLYSGGGTGNAHYIAHQWQSGAIGSSGSSGQSTTNIMSLTNDGVMYIGVNPTSLTTGFGNSILFQNAVGSTGNPNAPGGIAWSTGWGSTLAHLTGPTDQNFQIASGAASKSLILSGGGSGGATVQIQTGALGGGTSSVLTCNKLTSYGSGVALSLAGPAGGGVTFTDGSATSPTALIYTVQNANSGTITFNTFKNSVTLSTGSTTTNLTNAVPAGSYVVGVGTRVTTTITTAANWSLQDGAGVNYINATTNLTAGNTNTGFIANGTTPGYTASSTFKIVTNANPGAGVVEVEIYYYTITPPTS